MFGGHVGFFLDTSSVEENRQPEVDRALTWLRWREHEESYGIKARNSNVEATLMKPRGGGRAAPGNDLHSG